MAPLLRWIKILWSRNNFDGGLRDEMRIHVELRSEELIGQGLSPAEAKRCAALELGSCSRYHQESREAAGLQWFDDAARDLHLGVRQFTRQPGFAFAAVLVTALGIGASTAAFSVLNHVLLKPPPYAGPDRLVMIGQAKPSAGYFFIAASAPNFLDWTGQSHAFDAAGAYTSFPANLSGFGDPRHLDGVAASSGVFASLGIKAQLGRTLTPSDDQPGAARVVVLSDATARSLFGQPSQSIGKSIQFDGRSFAVVGVMPPEFLFPNRKTPLWTNLALRDALFADRSNLMLNGIGRLAPGVSLEQATTRITAVARRLERAFPKDNQGVTARIIPMSEFIQPQSRLLLTAVFGAAICLLLIACVNLANLLLARSLTRRREMAIRASIGAGRWRIVRQLIAENGLIVFLGGAAGIALAVAGTPWLAWLVPDSMPVSGLPTADRSVLLFALVSSIAVTIAASIGPLLRLEGASAANALRERSLAAGSRLRSALVVAEVAGTVTLLVGTGLLTRALWKVQTTDPGFRAERVLTLRTALPFPAYNAVARRDAFYAQVLGEVRSLPGVESAAYTGYLPMVFGGGIFPSALSGDVSDPSKAISSSIRFLTPGYFQTMGISVRGRDFTGGDSHTAPYVAVISESLAKRLWPNQDPLGKSFNIAFADRTVIGVAKDVAVRGLEASSEPQVYLSAPQVADRWLTFHMPKDLAIRTSSDNVALGLAPALRDIIRRADAAVPVTDVQLMQDIVDDQTSSRRAQLSVLAAFGLLAFLLAGIGIHGLLNYTVGARTSEVGIRLALGAKPAQVLRLFLQQGAMLGLTGCLLALPLAYLFAKGVSKLLAGGNPVDPLTYLLSAAAAIMLSVAGSLGPAIRAARTDPATAIRQN